ncbi:MAG: glycoside hydrolase family 30 [Paenibacillaceae bacterium]|nr:glycoside hydrolase family 30 [Paenibacillaceae bacterium]
MNKLWWRKAVCLQMCLVLCFLYLSVPSAAAEDVPLQTVSITFDDYASIADADLGYGGALAASNVSLDSSTRYGDSGKSLKISGRTKVYNRLKLNGAFGDMEVNAGDRFMISMWAKVGAESPVTNGYFYLSVVTYPGSKTEADPPYYYDQVNYKFLIGQDGWTQLTLPYPADGNPIYGIAVEQASSSQWPNVVPVVYIDQVEVSKLAPVEPPSPPVTNVIDFNDAAGISGLGIGAGGGQNMLAVSLSDTVVHGTYGQSLRIGERSQMYNRIKLNDAFKNLDLTPGTMYDLSLYARAGAESGETGGYFYLSVIDIAGSLQDKYYYNQKEEYNALVTELEWTKVSLPFTVGMDPVLGIAIEQMAVEGYRDVIREVYIDDVVVTKTGVTDEIPPPRTHEIELAVTADGNRVSYVGNKAIVKDNLPYIPLLRTLKQMHADVVWDSVYSSASISKWDTTVLIAAGDAAATVNGAAVPLEAPGYLTAEGVFMVPASFFHAALNAEVIWDEAGRTVVIQSPKIQEIRLDKGDVQQELWGFGGAANEPVHDLMNYDHNTREMLLDQFFGTEGDQAGLSIVRLEVNPFTKDDPDPRQALQASIQPAEGIWDWDTDQHQRWFAEQALLRNPDMQFAASVWSPPAWMKDNQSATLGGHLKPEYYQTFADYLLAWAQRYKVQYGYNLKWLSIQNEPGTLVKYASAMYTNEEMNQVASIVADTFNQAELEVGIGAPEGGNLQASMRYLEGLAPEVLQKLDYAATHFYAWSDLDVYNYDLRKFNKPLFMMEYCVPAPNKSGIDGGIEVAEQIGTALQQGYSSYLYWLYVSKPTSPSVAPTRESLVDLKTDGTYTINKRLYAMGQFSRFMRPGDHYVHTESGSSDIIATASINGEGQASVVAVNRSSEPVNITITGVTAQAAEVYRTSQLENIVHIGQTDVESGFLTYTLAPQSVTTFVEISAGGMLE